MKYPKVNKVILFNAIKLLHLPIKASIVSNDNIDMEFIPEGVLVNRIVLIPVSNIEQIEFERVYEIERGNDSQPKKSSGTKAKGK